MKSIFKFLGLAMLTLCACLGSAKAGTPPGIQWQNQFNTDWYMGAMTNPNSVSTSGYPVDLAPKDWIYGIKQTSDGGYIGVGVSWADNCQAWSGCFIQNNTVVPSVIKLDKNGNKVWDAKFPNNQAGTYAPCNGGQLQSVTEIAGGYYVAVGYQNSFGVALPFIVIMNSSGVVNTYFDYVHTTAMTTILDATKLMDVKRIYDGSTNDVLVTGTSTLLSGDQQMYAARLTVTPTTCGLATGAGWEHAYGSSISSGGTFDAEWGNSGTPLYANGSNADGTPVGEGLLSGFAFCGAHKGFSASDRDMYIVYANQNGDLPVPSYWSDPHFELFIDSDIHGIVGTCSTQTNMTAPVPSFSTPVAYSKTFTSSAAFISSIPGFTNSSHDDIGESIIQNANGNIVVAGLFNQFSTGCDQSRAHYKDGYRDADGVLMEIDLSHSPTFGIPTWIKNFAHLSGENFDLKVEMTSALGYAVNGATADAGVLNNSSDENEMLMTKTDATGSVYWTKGILALGTWNNATSYCFDQTTDGGYILGGNNHDNWNNYVFTKLANDCQANVTSNVISLNASIASASYIVFDGPTNQVYLDGVPHPFSYNPSNTIVEQIIIPSGKYVTFNTLTLNFLDTKQVDDEGSSHKHNILVQKGGTLEIDNSVLQAYSECGPSMWDGIYVVGDFVNSPQDIVLPSHNGVVVMYNSTIADARVGVQLGTDGAGDGGGVINTDHSNFINCRVGVEFHDYFFALAGPTPPNNISSITHCLFDCTQQLPGYNGESFDTHIKMFKVSGVTIENNQFRNSGYNTAGYACTNLNTGIFLFQATIDLKGTTSGGSTSPTCGNVTSTPGTNTFSDLNYGIYSTGSNFPDLIAAHDRAPAFHFNPSNIYLCQMFDVQDGVTFEQTQPGEIALNFFGYNPGHMPTTTYTSISPLCMQIVQYYGIYLDLEDPDDNSNRFTFNVRNNRFSARAGIISNFYDIKDIMIRNGGIARGTTPGMNASFILNNDFLNACPTTGTTSGVKSIAIVMNDDDASMTKDIMIDGNTGDGHMFIDWTIADPNFKDNYTFSGTDFGANNKFSSGSTLSQNIQYLPTAPFRYVAKPGSIIPTVNTLNVITATSTPTNLISNLHTQINFCLTPPLPPTRPQTISGLNNDPMDKTFSLNIYPNPFNEMATISYNLPEEMGNAQMQIFNNIGQQLKVMTLTQGQQQITINAAELSSGIYYYSVFSKGQKLSDGKFVIAK